MTNLSRRSFLATGVAGLPAAAAAASLASCASAAPRRDGGPVAVSSGNGHPAVAEAVRLMQAGGDPADAAVAGVSIVEADPDDMSVGFGGLPNERGVVELDASVMHGPTHKAGAVAALRNIKHPSQVALQVLKRTDHVLLVGEGALQFAVAHGFPEENLLTDRARRAWLRWKENLTPADDWLDDDQQLTTSRKQAKGPIPRTWGTIHCSALDGVGRMGACTTTSGLSYKVPGRVGDSPIVGAGMFVDNEVGSAGATGRGESAIQSCGAFQVVQAMGRGLDPTEACLEVLGWIARHTKRRDLLNEAGEPDFGLTFYALRKDGGYGSASMRGRHDFSVDDGSGPRHEKGAALYGAEE